MNIDWEFVTMRGEPYVLVSFPTRATRDDLKEWQQRIHDAWKKTHGLSFSPSSVFDDPAKFHFRLWMGKTRPPKGEQWWMVTCLLFSSDAKPKDPISFKALQAPYSSRGGEK